MRKLTDNIIILIGLSLCSAAFSFSEAVFTPAANTPSNSLPSASTPNKLPYFTANYDAVVKGFAVSATREYKAINETQGELNFNAKSWIANLNETSRFSWDNPQIKPMSFAYERIVVGKEKKQNLIFDDVTNSIISTQKEKRTVIPNPENALDRLSFQLQVQYDLLNEKNNVTYQVADKGRIKQYRFEIVAQEKIETPLGSLKTIKVKVIRENKNRTTYLWMAADWHNLLARMEQYEDGKKEFELQVTSAIIDGETVTGL